MAEEIINRVAKSTLVTYSLEDLYPEGKRITIDISQWLWQGVVLKEKEFRAHIESIDTTIYQYCYIALYCSTEAIIPAWAYVLVSLQLNSVAKKVLIGSLSDLETILFAEILQTIDFSFLQDKPVIIKGCAHKPIPENAYLLLAEKIKPYAKSIMYGEACSAVPLFKNK